MKLVKIVFVAIAFWATTSHARDCLNWINLLAMRDAAIKPEGTIIVVQPFTNYTKLEEDNWLELGLGRIISDMIEAGSEGISSYNGIYAANVPAARNPSYIVNGMYQHNGNYLRVFVSMSDGKSAGLINQWNFSTFFPQDAEFFYQLMKIATEIIKTAKSEPDPGAIKQVALASTIPLSYGAYSQGMQLAILADSKNLPPALEMFAASKKLDPKSPWGYIGAINAYAMISLHNKLLGLPFGAYMQKLEGEMAELAKLNKGLPLSDWALSFTKGKPQSRFIEWQSYFVTGMYAAQEGKWSDAAKALESATKAVPEDAIAWQHLSRIYEKLGNMPQATAALEKSMAINPCMEER